MISAFLRRVPINMYSIPIHPCHDYKPTCDNDYTDKSIMSFGKHFMPTNVALINQL